jgi:dihydroxyacid dehydratase/phosphogluconate dehydratase
VADAKAHPLKWQSGGITDGPSRAPARAMLHAAGFTDADLKRPVIGVANTWIEIGPCNFHLRDLAVSVKAGIRAAGGTPMEFNTVSISDGITMGSAGMRTSLVSREVIADSIELVARGNLFDAIVILVGCDKTIPGAAMALARLDIPGLILYGGSIAPGRPGVTSRSRTCSKRSAHTRPVVSPTPSSVKSKRRRAPAPAHVEVSSPPTPWRPRASSSVSPRWAAATFPRSPRTSRRWRNKRASW